MLFISYFMIQRYDNNNTKEGKYELSGVACVWCALCLFCLAYTCFSISSHMFVQNFEVWIGT